MNIALSRMFNKIYRKEPITSFAVTIGAVDATIGGLGDRWDLFAFGLSTVGVAIALRWWQLQRPQPEPPQQAPEYYLPPSSSRPQLPLLTPTKKHPPHY